MRLHVQVTFPIPNGVPGLKKAEDGYDSQKCRKHVNVKSPFYGIMT